MAIRTPYSLIKEEEKERGNGGSLLGTTLRKALPDINRLLHSHLSQTPFRGPFEALSGLFRLGNLVAGDFYAAFDKPPFVRIRRALYLT